jgi:NAD-dependent DNA ligase
VTPVVEFKKVKLKGNDVKRAAISYSDFLKYKLAPGDEIKVIYDIVPYVTLEEGLKRSGKKKIKAPKVCPECGAELEISETGKKLSCPNKKCVCRLKGKILNYVTKVGIENISYETINDLYDIGCLKTIDDLYTLENHAKKIAELDGYGAVSLSRIFKSIEDNKVMSEAKFLGSLGIEGASIKTFHDILQNISYDELIEYGFGKNENALVGIHGIKEKLSSKVINGIYENRKLIEKLEEYLILTKEPKDVAGTFKVTFTKVRDDELEKWIRDNKGVIDNDSVKKDTSLVIVPKLGVSSSKVKAAQKYGIPVVEISEAKKYITERLL